MYQLFDIKYDLSGEDLQIMEEIRALLKKQGKTASQAASIIMKLYRSMEATCTKAAVNSLDY